MLIINGVNFIPYLAEDGIKWTRNDTESPEAGTMMDGTIRRDRIIMRRRMEITVGGGLVWRGKLTRQEMSMLQRAIYPQFIDVVFEDPLEGTVITRVFYSNNVPVTIQKFDRRTGQVWYRGDFTFPLVERGVPGEGAGSL